MYCFMIYLGFIANQQLMKLHLARTCPLYDEDVTTICISCILVINFLVMLYITSGKP